MSKYLDPKFWQAENFVDEPELHPSRKLTDSELSRRRNISLTTTLKLQNDPDFVKLKADAARKTAEIKRVVPVSDHAKLIHEYYDTKTQRESNAYHILGKRYGVKHGMIQKIVSNYHNTLPADEFQKLVDAYNKKYPNQRGDSLRKAHAAMTDEQRAQKDLNIQIAKDPVDADTAVAIYEECKYNRDNVHYKAAADKHLTKTGKKIPWQKARDITNGYHYATQDFDIDADVKEYRLRKFGTFKFTSPEGKVFHFEDEKSCGAWIQKMDKSITQPDPYRVCISMFDKTEANTPYVMRRRFFKGWTIENIKKVDF